MLTNGLHPVREGLRKPTPERGTSQRKIMEHVNKRIRFVAICLVAVSLSAFGQYSEIYSSREAAYTQGVDLYMQGQYEASLHTLETYHGTANAEQAIFYKTANAFELRRKDARKLLKNYIDTHPYTPYASEVHYMAGVLQTEQKKYKQALKELEQVKEEELFRQHQAGYLFHRGYCYLQTNEPQRAAGCFSRLKGMKSPYETQARYYYAFTQYTLQNYGKALPEFLAIEHTHQYEDIVPYYIIQIYYAQGQYEEVYERAEYLLSHDADNEHTAEIHRILGEIHYKDGQYEKAIVHLEAYQQAQTARKKATARDNLYMLGIAAYKTGDMQKAIDALNKVSKGEDAISESACYHLGNAYAQLGQTEQAKMAYSVATHYKINDKVREEALYNYALTTYGTSTALGESVNAFTDFLSQYPESAHKETVYSLLCEAFMNSRNYAAALEALENIGKPDRKTEETKQYLRYQLGADAFLQGKTDKAVEWFTAVIDHAGAGQQTAEGRKYVTESYFFRAESEYKLGQYEKAQADLKVFEARPDAQQSSNKTLARYLSGYTYFSQKDYKNAQSAFLEYIKSANKDEATYSDALNRIGDCYFNDRDFVRAESYYAKVIAQGGQGADYATFQRGYALGLLKRYGDKINTLEGLVKNYPKSDYADDALYEIARAELQRENPTEAIRAYERLLKAYPNSNMARKAMLEKGMIYYNQRDYAAAIETYKQVIKHYPSSEEAYSALDGMESAYIETDNISEYLAYTKNLGRINMKADSREDSLTYVAAERQYMLGNYAQAVAGLSKYISQYCEGGRYCTTAQYYAADSYDRLGQKEEAMAEYIRLTEIAGNPYMEEAVIRVAGISYDREDYHTSLNYFRKLQALASSIEKTNMARLGVLRCSYAIGDHISTVNVASQIIEDIASSPEVLSEALYNRGKAYMALKEYEAAITDLERSATEVRTAQGAEAKYLIAEAWFTLGNLEKAEAEIMSFAGMNTQHQYWLAKSFILLSDIYAKRGDTFQAKQYLLSLQSNYRVQDDIQETVKQRLALLQEREAEKLDEDED